MVITAQSSWCSVMNNIQGFYRPAIRRLAHRDGVKRIPGLVYDKTRSVLKVFLENVIRDAVIYTEHACRTTVSAMDVVYALNRQGRTYHKSTASAEQHAPPTERPRAQPGQGVLQH